MMYWMHAYRISSAKHQILHFFFLFFFFEDCTRLGQNCFCSRARILLRIPRCGLAAELNVHVVDTIVLVKASDNDLVL